MARCREHRQASLTVRVGRDLRLRRGIVAGFHVILAAVGKLLNAFGADVMIGEGEAIRGDERTGSSIVEAHGRKLRVIQPSLGELESIFRSNARSRRHIEKPHAFVGGRDCGDGQDKAQHDHRAFHPNPPSVSQSFAFRRAAQALHRDAN